jgi:hypothetical protein
MSWLSGQSEDRFSMEHHLHTFFKIHSWLLNHFSPNGAAARRSRIKPRRL